MRLSFSSVPLAVVAFATIATATPALSDEVNLYSSRQESLIRPILDDFEKDTAVSPPIRKRAFFSQSSLKRSKRISQRISGIRKGNGMVSPRAVV